MKRETAEVEASKLDESSRRVLAALAVHPIRPCANLLMERRSDARWSLLATIPSPTNDRRRNLRIWLDDDHGPSMEFGGWHTHADLWDTDPDVGLRRMLDYLERITKGEIVLAELPTIGDGMPFVSSMSETAKRFSMS